MVAVGIVCAITVSLQFTLQLIMKGQTWTKKVSFIQTTTEGFIVKVIQVMANDIFNQILMIQTKLFDTWLQKETSIK